MGRSGKARDSGEWVKVGSDQEERGASSVGRVSREGTRAALAAGVLPCGVEEEGEAMPLCTPAQPVRLGCAAPPKRRRLQAGSAPAAWHAGRRSHGGPAASGGAPLKGGHCSRGTPARGVSPPPASRSRVHVAPQSTVREGCWRLKASSRPSVSSGQRGLQLAVASRPVAQIRTQGVGGQSGCCPTRVCGGESCANLPAGDRWWGLVRAEASCRLGVGVWRSLWHHARGGATLEPLNHDGSPRAAIQPFNATYSEVGCHQIEAGKRVRLARTIGGGGGGGG